MEEFWILVQECANQLGLGAKSPWTRFFRLLVFRRSYFIHPELQTEDGIPSAEERLLFFSARKPLDISCLENKQPEFVGLF